jgi:hypothetical protein
MTSASAHSETFVVRTPLIGIPYVAAEDQWLTNYECFPTFP